MTSDSKAAESFYKSVCGWDAKDAGMTNLQYALFSKGPTPIAGLMSVPEEARSQGIHPMWLGFIGADNVDAYAARVKDAGGAIHHAPEDIPGIGRFAVVADPQGGMFALFKGQGEPPIPAPPGTPGHISWHELHAGDGAAAFDFYSKLFGWTQGEASDLGPMGVYQTFATDSLPIGGMMTKMPDTPAPLWLYYVNVDGVDAAVERVKQGGGKNIMEPHQVPGGNWIVHCFDPQGAIFAVMGKR